MSSGDASSTDEVLFDVTDRVATVTINRPERHNAMSWGVMTGLRSAMAEAAERGDVGAIVLQGAGERAFCAGADLGGMADDVSYAEIHDSRGELARLFGEMWSMGKPTIAKVRGYCLAGGFGLAMSCDLVIASDDSSFGTPEIDRGLWPFMITVPLCRTIPPKKALELMMTGRRIDAEEADALGCLTRLVSVDELDGAVDELAATLAAKSPSVMKLGRNAFYGVWDLAATDALRQLHPLLTVNTSLEDAREGISAFLEKRDPEWTGR